MSIGGGRLIKLRSAWPVASRSVVTVFSASRTPHSARRGLRRLDDGPGRHDGQMSQKMEGCSQLMQGMMGSQGGGRPNEQWQNQPPATPEQRG
jgi:hypothetical protein